MKKELLKKELIERIMEMGITMVGICTGIPMVQSPS